MAKEAAEPRWAPLPVHEFVEHAEDSDEYAALPHRFTDHLGQFAPIAHRCLIITRCPQYECDEIGARAMRNGERAYAAACVECQMAIGDLKPLAG